jgi:hypothetical protein
VQVAPRGNYLSDGDRNNEECSSRPTVHQMIASTVTDSEKEKPLPDGGTAGTQIALSRLLTEAFLRAAEVMEGSDFASASRSSESYSGGTFSSLHSFDMMLEAHSRAPCVSSGRLKLAPAV